MTEDYNRWNHPVARVTRAKPNTMAAVALGVAVTGFLSVVGFPLAIILGHIALKQIKRTHEGGRGAALAALWIGYGAMGVGMLTWLLVFAVAMLYPF